MRQFKTGSRRLFGRRSARGVPFAVHVLLAALLGLALSPLTVTARGALWLGPQTLILGGAGTAAALAVFAVARRYAGDSRAAFLDPPRIGALAVPSLLIAAPLLAMAILRLAFDAFPDSADEYAFLFQARTFLAGRLSNPPPPDPVLFAQNYIIAADGRWVGQYLPGWPAFLALVQAAGLPAWSAAPLAGALLLFVLAAALRRECSSAAVAAALLFACAASGFFLLNAATYFSHCFSAAAVLATVYCLLRAEAPASPWWAAAGACAGWAALCRVDSGLLALTAALAAWGERGFSARALLAGLLGFAPAAAALLAYDAAITGNPLTIPTMWAGNLHVGLDGVRGVVTWVGGYRVPIQTAWRLGELADTASLLLPALYLFALVERLRARGLRFYDLLPLVNLVLFMVFPDLGGFQMGPRYWFDGFVAMHLTVGGVFTATASRRRFAVAVCLMLGALSLARLPGQVAFFSRVMRERATVYRLAAALPKDRRSVVLVPDFPSAWNRRFNRTTLNLAMDFARNGISFDAPVLFGRGDAPDATARACRLFPGAAVYAFRLDRDAPDGTLSPQDCPAGLSPPGSAGR